MATATEDPICLLSKVVLEVCNELLALLTLETSRVPHPIWSSMLHLSVDIELAVQDVPSTPSAQLDKCKRIIQCNVAKKTTSTMRHNHTVY